MMSPKNVLIGDAVWFVSVVSIFTYGLPASRM